MSREIDSGMLQYTPKGAYYEGSDEQFLAVKRMWDGLFDYDRALFALISILNGTGFSKGAMTHKLLSNPVAPQTGKELIPEGLDSDFERRVILFNLYKTADETMARALRNLLMLTGGELHSRVNNSRTKKLILEFIFGRENRELDSLAINFKSKLAKLVRHALGKQELYKILNGDQNLFEKRIGRYNMAALPVVLHLFNKTPVATVGNVSAYYPNIENYWKAKEAAKTGNIKEFEKLIDKLPWRVAMGFRNSYKLDVDRSKIMGKSKMSNKEELITQAAVKRSGAKSRKVNYKAQEIYDLWKALYFKVVTKETEGIKEINDAIVDKIENKLQKLNFGEKCMVVLDTSHSMMGSEERPLHPFLTGLCIASSIENVMDVIFVGGKYLTVDDADVRLPYPANGSPIWKGLVDAVVAGAENIIVISDGYENAVKGMFDHVYKHFKETGFEFNLVHINPVFAADAKSGSARQLAEGIEPMPVTNHKYLETEFIFNQIIDNTEAVKQLLVNKYKKLIGGS